MALLLLLTGSHGSPQVTLYYIPDVTEEELARVEEEAREYFQGVAHRRELKGKVLYIGGFCPCV